MQQALAHFGKTASLSNQGPDESLAYSRGHARTETDSSMMPHREKVHERISNAEMSREYRMKMYRKVLGEDDEEAGFCSTLCNSSSETGFWVDSNQFKVLICAVVITNAAYVGVTVVDEELENKASLALLFCELIFLTAFSVELALRLTARGVCAFLQDGWSYFDLLLVLANAVEVVATLIQIANIGSLTTAAAVLRVTRILRLMRVFQIVRLFRFVDELHLLIKGIVSALRTLVWSMGMLFAVIYICSLVITKYLGQTSENDTTRYYFGSLGRSMFTLFSFVTLEGWPDVARHLMDTEELGGFIVALVILYILFTNLALLNLVTAVLVDSVVNISNSDDKKRMERFNKQRKESIRRLEQVFSRIDENGSGELSYEEFQAGVSKSKEVREMIQSLDIAVEDAEELFHLLDFDENGKINSMEFIEGAIMCKAGDPVSRHLLSFHYDVRKYFTLLGEAQESIVDLLSKEFNISHRQRKSLVLPKPRLSTFRSREMELPRKISQISSCKATPTSQMPISEAVPECSKGEVHQDLLSPFRHDSLRSERRGDETPPRSATSGVEWRPDKRRRSDESPPLSANSSVECVEWRSDNRSESPPGEPRGDFCRVRQSSWRAASKAEGQRRTADAEQGAASDEGLAGMEARLTELLRALEERVAICAEGMEHCIMSAQQQRRHSGQVLRSPQAAPMAANSARSSLAEATLPAPEPVAAKLPRLAALKGMGLPGMVGEPDDWQEAQKDQAPVRQQSGRSQRTSEAPGAEPSGWFPIVRT